MSGRVYILAITIFALQSQICSADTHEELTREVGYPAAAMSGGTLKAISDLDAGSPEVNCLLGYAVGNSDCAQAATVKALLDKGAVPAESAAQVTRKPGLFSKGFSCDRGQDLSHPIRNGCANVVQLIVEKMEPSEVERGIGASDGLFSAAQNKGQEESKRDQKNRAMVAQIIATLKQRCEHDGGGGAACEQAKKVESKENTYVAGLKERADAEAAARTNAEQQRKDAERAAVEAESSPSALKSRACEAVSNIQLADKQMAHEREVGQESGYVNTASLHELGQMKVYARHDLESLRVQYKRATGKDFDSKQCKTRSVSGG